MLKQEVEVSGALWDKAVSHPAESNIQEKTSHSAEGS